jgi:hypothetical protein
MAATMKACWRRAALRPAFAVLAHELAQLQPKTWLPLQPGEAIDDDFDAAKASAAAASAAATVAAGIATPSAHEDAADDDDKAHKDFVVDDDPNQVSVMPRI